MERPFLGDLGLGDAVEPGEFTTDPPVLGGPATQNRLPVGVPVDEVLDVVELRGDGHHAGVKDCLAGVVHPVEGGRTDAEATCDGGQGEVVQTHVEGLADDVLGTEHGLATGPA